MKSYKNGRILMGLGIFMAFMLVCTLISKGIYASRLPQVSVLKPRKMSINHEVKAAGNVKQGRELAVNVPAGMRVSEVMVIAGDTVEAGQTLFLLDTGDLKEQISDKELEVKKLQLQITTLQNNLNLSGEQKDRKMQRAGEDAVDASLDGQKSVDRALEDENKARQELQEHSSKEPGITSEEKRKRIKEEYGEWREQLKNALREQRENNAEKEALQQKIAGLKEEIADLKSQLPAETARVDGISGREIGEWFVRTNESASESVNPDTFADPDRENTGTDAEQTGKSGNRGSEQTGNGGPEAVEAEEGAQKPENGSSENPQKPENGPAESVQEPESVPSGGTQQPENVAEDSTEESESVPSGDTQRPDGSQTGGENRNPGDGGESVLPEAGKENGDSPDVNGGTGIDGNLTGDGQSDENTLAPANPSGDVQKRLEQKLKELAEAEDALTAMEEICRKTDERVAGLQDDERSAPDFAAEDAQLAAWIAQQKSLEGEVTSAQRVLEDARDAKEDRVNEANRSLEDSLLPEMSDATLGIYRMELSRVEQDVEKMKTYLAENGEIRAEMAGTVTRVGVSVGESTTAGAAVIFADTSQPLQFEIFLDKEQKKYVELGAQAQLELGTGGMGNKIPVTVDYLTELENAPGSYSALMILPEETGRIGQSGSFSLNVQSESYPVCIGLDALHMDENQRYFVYVLGEADTILGKELTAEKRMVEVLDKNDSYAALSPGVVDEETQLISTATKEFGDGDVVRMKE